MATTPTCASNAHTKPRTKLLTALRKPTSSDSSDSSADSASDASDVESKTSTPRKRLFKAPTPRARTQTPEEEEEEEEEIDAESAYMRMKQRLAAEKETQEQQAQKPEPVQAPALSSDEEASMPVRKLIRKSTSAQQQRPSPRASPSPSVRSCLSSPGLFVSPGPSPARQTTGSDSEESSQRASAANLQERVKRIRAERLAKQQQEAAQLAQQNASKRTIEANVASDDDAEVDRRLTQQSKPTRRAGKKAMEAMARDQQRISRNMQLTHQSKTKKRYTTKDLFAKFGFNAPDDEETTAPPTPKRSAGLVSSDVEAQAMHDTPPTSPPRQDDMIEKDSVENNNTTPKAVLVEDLEEVTPVPSRLDKGKGRAPEFAHLPPRTWPVQAQAVTVQQAQVPTASADDVMVELSDSDDESKQKPKSRFAVFDKIRTKEQDESKSFVTLRHLAHLTSPKQTRKGHRTISRSEMHFSLAQRARQQAQKAREEKVEELKRRGIHVETAEEREKHQMEVEDLVGQFERQRQEDLKLAKMEKKEAKANGETDELPSSDEEDEDYVGSGEENAAEDDNDDQEDEEEVELELSGSEDEQMEDEDANPSNDLIDGAAEEDAGSEAEEAQMAEVDELADDDEDSALPVRKPTSNRTRRVVDDDDESDNEPATSGSPTQQATQDDAMAAFGFGRSSPGPGLTQMFAGTMANLDDSQATQEDAQQDSLYY